MAWYDEAVFYHIYPLGLTGAPKENAYGAPEHRLNTLLPWIDHIKAIGCNAIYIGPLFESVGHGYETTDYKKLDSRLGPAKSNRTMLNAILYWLNTGIPWRDLPERFGPWKSVYSRFRAWTHNNVWENVFSALVAQDLVGGTALMLDSTAVKVHQHGSGAKKGAITGKPDEAGEG